MIQQIEHEIQVIKYYNRLTRSTKKTYTYRLWKGRSKKAIELNLLRKLKNKVKRG